MKRYLWGAAALATAAVAIWMVRSGPRVHFNGARMEVHRSRGGRSLVLASGDTIRAGDELRVVVTLPKPGQVAAEFVDANGREGNLTGAVSLPDGERTLPGSIVVDNPCVDLRVAVRIDGTATLTVPLHCEK